MKNPTPPTRKPSIVATLCSLKCNRAACRKMFAAAGKEPNDAAQ